MSKRILTGVKPTGEIHIGNYFGAMKPALELSKEGETFLFIADYHALNYITNKDQLKDFSYKLAASYLAIGLDPEKITFFRQSDVPEVFELNWIISNVTPKGLMNRAHAYKAIVENNEKEGLDKDSGVNMGLFNYPILMAADILLYDSNFVPVGLDQKQHVEIARDIAGFFNNRYGETFVLPEPKISEEVAVIPGLDGRKMSKSYGNTIPLFCDEKTLQKTINKIVTNSLLPGQPKDENCTLANLYKLFAADKDYKEYQQKLKDGMGWGDAKKELFNVMNKVIAPMREKYNYYLNNLPLIEQILSMGAVKARKEARKVLSRVRKKIGVNGL